MIKLSIKETGSLLGTISEADLSLLIDQLEEESPTDVDYFICAETIDILAENGGSSTLIRMLRDAVGDTKGVEIVWSKDLPEAL